MSMPLVIPVALDDVVRVQSMATTVVSTMPMALVVDTLWLWFAMAALLVLLVVASLVVRGLGYKH